MVVVEMMAGEHQAGVPHRPSVAPKTRSAHHASSFAHATLPCTSVRRSRGRRGDTSALVVQASRCRIVAWKSWTWTLLRPTVAPDLIRLAVGQAALDAAAG